MDELEEDSRIYDAYTKGNNDGRIAGLKEAVGILKHEAVEFGTIGDGLGDLMAEQATRAILSRISQLEKD